MDRRPPLLPVLKCLVFFVPLAFYVGLDDTYDLPKLTVLYLGSLALLGTWLGWGLWRGEIAVARTPLESPLAAMALLLLVTTYFSWDKSGSLLGLYGHYMFGALPLLACALLFQLSAATLKEPPARIQLLRTLLGAAALAAAYAILQYWGLELFARVGANPGGRVWSTFGNPLYLGAYLMMGIIIASGMALAAQPLGLAAQPLGLAAQPLGLAVSPPARIGYVAIAALLTAALSLTGSRSAWLGLGVGQCLLAVWGLRFAADRRAVALSLGMPPAMALALILFFPPLRARLASIPHEGFSSPRVQGWISGLRIAADHPLVGTGPDTFAYAFRMYKSSAYHEVTRGNTTQAHAHNDLIQWAATTGFLGLGIYLWVVIAAAAAGLRALKRSPEPELAACVLAAVAALGVANLFNFSTLATNVTAAILLGGLLATDSRASVLRISAGPRARGIAGILLGLAFGYGVMAAVGPWRADAAFKSALGDLTVNRRMSAVRRMEAAVSRNPWVSLYRTRLGSVYRDLARGAAAPEEKRRWIDRALRSALEDAGRHPMAGDNWNNLGVVWMHRADLLGEDHREQAFAAFSRAVRLDPLSAEIWANLARMAHYFVEPDREKSLWRLVLELDPRHKAARMVLDARPQKREGVHER